MKTLKIVSWNLNSLRIRSNHLSILVKEQNPDVILLQETRLKDMDIKEHIPEGYYSEFLIDDMAGYSGVGILSKAPMEITYQYTSRVLIVYIPEYKLSLGSLYVYNGFSETANITKKKALYELIFKELPSRDNLILGGDWNIALDTACTLKVNPFSQEEKDIYEQMYHKFVGAGISKLITWWDYRYYAYKRNLGLGLDEFFMTKSTHATFSKLDVLKKYRSMTRPSDHAPIVVNIDYNII